MTHWTVSNDLFCSPHRPSQVRKRHRSERSLWRSFWECLLSLSPQKTEDLKFFDPTLNDSQKTAVRFALESPELACIHGPPGTLNRDPGEPSLTFFLGTGKTHTLIELIRQLCASTPPQRVLVCGASNLAVDNILERLIAIGVAVGHKSDSSVPVATRIGHPARVMPNPAVLDATLEARSERSDQAALAKGRASGA